MDNELKKINTLTVEERLKLPLSKIKMSSRLFNILKNEEFKSYEDETFKKYKFLYLGDVLNYFKKTDERSFYIIPGCGKKTRLELFKLIQHSFPEEFGKRIDMWNKKEQTYTFE